MTLVGNQKVIFLDEPPRPGTRADGARCGTSSAAGRRGDDHLIRPVPEEAASSRTRRGLDGGRIVAPREPAELKARIPGGHIELAFADRATRRRREGASPGGRDDDALRSARRRRPASAL